MAAVAALYGGAQRASADEAALASFALARGQVALEAGDAARARRYFETARDAAPGRREILRGLALAQEAESGPGSIVAAWDAAHGADRENAEVAFRRARALLVRYGSPSAHRAIVERLPAGYGRSLARGRYALEVAERTRSPSAAAAQRAEARAALEEAHRLEPGRAAPSLALARLHEGAGESALAVARLREALTLEPSGLSEEGTSHAALLGRALFHFAGRDAGAAARAEALAEAEDLLERGLGIARTFGTAVVLGRVRLERHEREGAEAPLRAAIEAFVEAVAVARTGAEELSAVRWLAHAYGRLGLRDLERASWLRALELRPTDANAAVGLGRLLLREGRAGRALAPLRWAEAFAGPSRTEVWPGWLALATLAAGDARAAADLARARAAAGTHGILGIAQLVAGDPEGGLEAFDAGATDAYALVGRAQALAALGRIEASRRAGGAFERLGLLTAPEGGGLAVLYVIPGSPAAQAAVRPGDRIVGVGPAPTRQAFGTSDWSAAFAAAARAGRLDLDLLRAGSPERVVVALDAAPGSGGGGGERSR